MFQPGEVIIYSGHGVCRVKEVGHPSIPGANPDKLYYKLAPVYEAGDIYIPVDSRIFMRPIITKEEAEDLICRLSEIREKSYAITNSNTTQARNFYESILETHDCAMLFGLLKGFRAKAKRGRRLGQVDTSYRKRVEVLLYGELAAALDIPLAEAADRIERAIRGAG